MNTSFLISRVTIGGATLTLPLVLIFVARGLDGVTGD